MKKINLLSYLLLITLVCSQAASADGLEDYRNRNKANSKSVKNPAIDGLDKVCVCECIDGKWVCTPKSENCGGVVTACDGKSVNTDRDINSQVRPDTVYPDREIGPKSLPGDQFKPKKLPGDQFKPKQLPGDQF